MAGTLTCFALPGALAIAQDDTFGLGPEAYRAAYTALAADPADIDLLYALVRRAELDAAAGAGDADRLYRSAARLDERILLVDEGASPVALRLGEIQYCQRNYVVAEGYFFRPLADPAMPPDIRGRAEAFAGARPAQETKV